ncbi:DNA-3-methyladenine glycosylase [Curtobacterium sp. MCJR17_055]|uniref:DNA-3-methyladenine glycosylase 2 family protein n=1 Tax=unclassified Curtobacterium TaxID=257496 RepID=UPI000D9F8B7E|nr:MULTISPECIES: AlkA N-terminal domain-containing protein [unclassified Curtobacterium]PYY37729.1 DNA-3-methyladenine glycosylase [Curtobacterium sp. MCBD17_029]PYY56757.1 DNA-3-methyladenine glycosylase [Curtobacterium sp. MCJR17_055]PYY62329.1 DNA-3-methyladenine glycosylase [Curtobacterium sp. MCPF17_015]
MTTTGAGALHDERYRIAASRDARFDGQFVTAVHSTGIYCRPSCPARTPRSTGVTFYRTSAAAHLAGFRACRRCLPEATPGSPEWDLREDVAGRAMRLVVDGVVDREGVPGLARRVGYSERQLNRIMTEELGAGPKALSRAHRAQTARTLLTGSDLPVADVAFAAGFTSIRQFNDTVREVFALTPTELRAHRRSAPGSDGALRVHLPARPPFDVQGLLEWHALHALPGMEQVGTGADGRVTSYGRVLDLPGGPAWFRASAAAEDGVGSRSGRRRGTAPRGRGRVGLDLLVRLTDLSDLPTLVARVRALFDLDADPVAVDDALAAVPALAPVVDRVPGMRLPGAVDPHEVVFRTLIGQQVSVAAARTAQTRLVAALGTPVPEALVPEALVPGAAVARTFPRAAVVAERGREVLRGPAARVDTIMRVAAALADGSLVVDGGQSLDDLRSGLLAVKGIGPWTADYVALRVRHHPDLFLHSDLAVRNGAQELGLPGTARELSLWSERVAPWRSYLTMHCWRPIVDRAMDRTAATSTTSGKDPR